MKSLSRVKSNPQNAVKEALNEYLEWFFPQSNAAVIKPCQERTKSAISCGLGVQLSGLNTSRKP